MSCFFVTHPEVVIEPFVSIEEWGLSRDGMARASLLPDLLRGSVRTIISSAERKALDTAGIVARGLGLDFSMDAALGEMDRSATGYLPPDEFERTVDSFFALPEQSVRGWERAIDAQHRVEMAVRAHVQSANGDAIAFIGHGGVGGLLLSSLSTSPISRDLDQPGMGSYFSFDAHNWRALSGWERIG
jgi:broad specificity phosphatase PhoE